MFHKYQRVFIANNTIIAKQVGFCGIVKLFDVKPNVQYDINLVDFRRGNKNYRENGIIILDVAMRIIGRIDIIRKNNLFYNIDNQKIYVGIVFKNARLNDYFYLKDILITSMRTINSNEPTRIIKTDEDVEPLSDFGLTSNTKMIEPDTKHPVVETISDPELIIESVVVAPKIEEVPRFRDIADHHADHQVDRAADNIDDDDEAKFEIMESEMTDDVYTESADMTIKSQDKELIENALNAPSIEFDITEDHHFSKEEDVKPEESATIASDDVATVEPAAQPAITNAQDKPKYGFTYPKYNTVAIVIPCHSKHFRLLRALLESIERQTLVPDEVIVILCDSVNVSHTSVNELRFHKWKFNFELVEIRNRSPAGANRYIGCKKATSEIIIFTDADDLIHPQRTEIIKYFFDITDAVHVGHSFTFDTNFDKKTYDIPKIMHKIPIFTPGDRIPGMTDGAVAILRSIVDKFAWDRSLYKNEDVAFNKSVFRTFRRSCMIYAPIYLYRTALSTWQGENEFNKTKFAQMNRRTTNHF